MTLRLLTHEQAAELLFADGRQIPAHLADVEDRVIEQLKAHGGDPRHFADELAQEYARHPETAAAHMKRCLDAFAGDVIVPDWPERGPDGHLYTGLGDDDLDD
jgi:hypothetical protein